jgi:hypothetical protein
MQVVWDVVAVADVHAMAAGRKYMYFCNRVPSHALRIPRYVCKRGAHGPILRSGLVFTSSLLCIVNCRVRAGMLWVPRILFFLSPASPTAYLFGYLPLTMLLLRFTSCMPFFLLLILLGCRQFRPVCLCSFCFASPSACWCSIVVSSFFCLCSSVLHCCFHRVFLCFPSACCASGVLLDFLYLWFPCSYVPLALLFSL